jgi:carboxymethylenebutenolidase
MMRRIWQLIWKIPEIAVVVSYTSEITGGSFSGQLTNEAPLMIHRAGSFIGDLTRTRDVVHTYETAKSPSFVLPGHHHYHAGPAGVAHTRSLGWLKKYLWGPNFDLEAIWEEHTLYEFGERDVEKTMATMVEEPYVNHVPTVSASSRIANVAHDPLQMTGGVGRAALTTFYRNHFIFSNPPDTTLELISRTVGIDRVIDEFIFCFTHTKVIDWLIPGIPPTNLPVRVPFTSVVNIRGDRLYHEHIAWDQASVLRQLGLLPEWLPFPYPLPDGRVPGPGKRFEYRVPAAGVETSAKMEDEGAVLSNELMEGCDGKGWAVREVDDISFVEY